MAKKSSTYKDAGVDIAAADKLLEGLDRAIASTKQPWQVGGIGGFSGLFKAPSRGMKTPLLCACTDSVGTKVLLAKLLGKHDTVGIDVVAMCVNDMVVCGAKPLAFLDYFATGGIRQSVAHDVIAGVARGCRQAGCALIGGETAEMPDLYAPSEYDLAGFAVGVVDAARVLDGKQVRTGDAVLGLASTGVHSNGFSLIRKAFSKRELKGALGLRLLKPTRIYVRELLELQRNGLMTAAAHITGGGLPGNLPRCLPKGCSVRIDRRAWRIPAVFKHIQRKGSVTDEEMFRVFNMGIGMAVVCRPGKVERIRGILSKMKQRSYVIGEVVKGDGEVTM